MGHILYQIFKIILMRFKKAWKNIDNPSVKIYVSMVDNRITVRIKNGDRLELLTLETMKLLGCTENKVTKDKNGENVPHLQIIEVVLVNCNIANNSYQQESRFLFIILEISPANRIIFS